LSNESHGSQHDLQASAALSHGALPCMAELRPRAGPAEAWKVE